MRDEIRDVALSLYLLIDRQHGRSEDKLTDDDLDQIAGKRDQLEGKIQVRYGIEKDRAMTDIDDWYGRQGW